MILGKFIIIWIPDFLRFSFQVKLFDAVSFHVLVWGYCTCRLERFFCRKSLAREKKDPKKYDEISSEAEVDNLSVERIRIENMELRFALCFSLFLFQTNWMFILLNLYWLFLTQIRPDFIPCLLLFLHHCSILWVKPESFSCETSEYPYYFSWWHMIHNNSFFITAKINSLVKPSLVLRRLEVVTTG